MSHGLSEATVARLRAVLNRHPEVKKAVLYGSRAKGNYRNGSDIDLTLMGGDELRHPILSALMTEIDDLLLPYSMDLSIFRELQDPELIAHIQRVGVPFYEKSP